MDLCHLCDCAFSAAMANYSLPLPPKFNKQLTLIDAVNERFLRIIYAHKKK